MAAPVTESIRTDNTLALIRSLRTHGAMARIDLAAANQLSSATVTSISGELIDQGIVVERPPDSQGPGHRGRPKTLIALHPHAACVITVKLSINEVRFTVGNFCGELHHDDTLAVDTLALTAEALSELLIRHIDDLCLRMTSACGPVASICVAVQGIVSPLRGSIVWSPAFTLRNVDIVSPLRARFACPVQLENDANCISAAITRHPDYMAIPNLAVIMLGYGVGMAIMIDGKPYLGAHGSSAEFGHTKYEANGALCACGKRGCIEAYVSDYALYRDAHTLLPLPAGDSAHPSEEQMQVLVRLAEDGNPIARQIFDKAGHVLGTGIANILALFNPDQVLITGSGVRAYDQLKPSLEQALNDALVAELIGQTRLTTYGWDHDMTCMGAIQLALKAADRRLMQADRPRALPLA
ncbi:MULTISPECIES: ROK family protein [Modicisalibacter]|uniref:ROK family protein n=1 Tax=Modicisalibacter TaxID=574347 RepID=UPI00100A55A4|nr:MULTISPECIES: ROK family protein [Halomonadaceae]MBZ9560241.1 ROK family transcriptional regulator [Modicisalibacter sp. R2A 31.J]MBZ9576150.1 ROK family transcriptional regulator [Modicisalibacter sp. MOD 31.J]